MAEVSCRGSSQPLQRVMTDFGADTAFGRVPNKLKEHYGIEMPVSTIQRVTERHAQNIYEQEAQREIAAGMAGGITFIGEMDGSMVPVVEVSPNAEDKRKDKNLCWREVRLNIVHPQGSATPTFGGNFAGGVDECGRQVETLLQQLGYELTPVVDSHLCCGSAGTYSLLQPQLSQQLLQQKLAALQQPQPQVIATANIGCQLHLASQAGVPVMHWLELLVRQ